VDKAKPYCHVRGDGSEIGFGQLAYRDSNELLKPPPSVGWPHAHRSALAEGEQLVEERESRYCTRQFTIPLSLNGVGNKGHVSGRIELFDVVSE
jgi:hypothetical protein